MRVVRLASWTVAALTMVTAGAAHAVPADPELAAVEPAALHDGRIWVEKPRIVLPLRAEEPLASGFCSRHAFRAGEPAPGLTGRKGPRSRRWWGHRAG